MFLFFFRWVRRFSRSFICLRFWVPPPINCKIFVFICVRHNQKKKSNSFCPALAYIADSMGLNEDLAGVTLLAFGNGSPDIFTALANYEGDTEMLYAELFGI